MYQVHVVRPRDVPGGKGPPFKPFWDTFMRYSLRGGFTLQLFGYILISIASLWGNQTFQIFTTITGNSDSLKNCPIVVLLIGSICGTLGSVCIQNFRSIADDDAR